MQKLVALLLAVVMVFGLVACGNKEASKPAEPTPDAAPAPDATPAEDAGSTAEPAAPADGDLTFAIIPKSAGNPYNERMASGFEEACAALGVKSVVQYPNDISAEAQIQVINNLVAQKVNGIAVGANDAQALESTLTAAKDAGIVVVTLDSDAKGSQLFVNQAGVTEVAQGLVDAIYDMAGGEGQFAVLSATSTATNQNSWIAGMEQIIKDEKYSKLEWVETVYGDDEPQKSTDEPESLLTKYPDLKVICCPPTVGILACAQAVERAGSSVKVAGLGLPSEMNGHVGDDKSCPYMSLWNPIDVGSTAAYAIKAIVDGADAGTVGGSITVKDGDREILAPDESVGVFSNQIIVGPPFTFDGDNIGEWAEVY